MARIARIWTLKGYFRAAEMMVERGLAVDPRSRELIAVRSYMAARLAAARRGGADGRAHGPPVGWLDFLLNGKRRPDYRRDVIALAGRLENDPLVQVEAGMSLLEERRYDESLAVLGRALPGFSCDSSIWQQIPQEAFSATTDREFVRACADAVRDNPDHALARRSLAFALAMNGRLAAAVDQLREAQRIMPRCRRTRNELATVLVRARDFPAAEAIFRELLAEDPNDRIVRANMATGLLRAGRVEEAVAEYRKLHETSPEDPTAMVDLAEALTAAGELSEAIGLYKAADRASPGNARILTGLGTAYGGQGRFQDAVQQLGEALRVRPQYPRAMLEMGWLHIENGNPTEAGGWFTGVLRARPYDPAALEGLYKSLMLSGRVAEATEIRQMIEEMRSGRIPVQPELEREPIRIERVEPAL
jgi:Flp pilus assembly protein TadD